MASLYRRNGSPFLWVKYRDAAGKVRQTSTGCRADNAPDIRRARQFEARLSLEELQYGDAQKIHKGWAWVPDFLRIRYASSALSHERYACAWDNLRLFIGQNGIASPAGFLRRHCYDYVTWREKPDKKVGKYRACLNTAILEIKVLRIVMQEAVNRGMCAENPCLKLGLKIAKPREKPELTEEQCSLIRSEIPKVEDDYERTMLATSFEIARYQGCRLSETRLDPFSDVDLDRRRIRFRVKGGREHITLLHEKLVPLFTKLKADGAHETWTFPSHRTKSHQWAGNVWFRFLNRLGLRKAGVCFHSTRVTVITEMARNNVPESKAQRYVGHSSTTIHRVYQRLRPSDLSDCVDAVGIGAPDKRRKF